VDLQEAEIVKTKWMLFFVPAIGFAGTGANGGGSATGLAVNFNNREHRGSRCANPNPVGAARVAEAWRQRRGRRMDHSAVLRAQ